MTLTAGSLFSGVGGFDIGMEAAGFRTVFQVEWDAHCQAVLARHWPDVPRWSDVSGVNGADLPPCDVLTFGSPCQDLSVAGNRAGLAGSRSGLFTEATRIIREMRCATDDRFPRWAVWENVGGALSSARGRDFGAVLDHLADAGALVVEWAVLDARWFGVPQRRRRVFVVACFDPVAAGGCPDPLLPVGPRGTRNPAEVAAAGQDVAGTLGGGSGSRGWSPDTDRMTFVPVQRLAHGHYVERDEASTIRCHAGDGTSTDLVAYQCQGTNVGPMGTLRRGNGGLTGGVPFIEAQAFSENQRGEVVMSDHAHQLTTGGGKPGQGYPAVLMANGADFAPSLRTNAYNNSDPGQEVAMHVLAPAYPLAMRGRDDGAELEMGEADVYNALRAGDGGSSRANTVLTPALAVRRLTPVECERLMGWPDDHTRWRADGTEQADSHRYKQCGNGVAAPVAAWVGAQIRTVIERAMENAA